MIFVFPTYENRPRMGRFHLTCPKQAEQIGQTRPAQKGGRAKVFGAFLFLLVLSRESGNEPGHFLKGTHQLDVLFGVILLPHSLHLSHQVLDPWTKARWGLPGCPPRRPSPHP